MEKDLKKRKLRIGELLVESKLISQADLQKTIEEQSKTSEKLGDCLIRLGYISENDFLNFLSKQLRMPFIDLSKKRLKAEIVQQLPEYYARRFNAIVVEKFRDGYLVGMVDPLDIYAVDELKRIVKKPIYLALIRKKDLERCLDLNYRRTGEISHLAEQLQEQLADDRHIELSQLTAEEGSVDSPIIKLIQSMFKDAVQVGASDIHIEPGKGDLHIRQRVDGTLQEQVVKEKDIAPALALRLKLMAGLNISEKRLPQDGRFSITVRNKDIDVRLSTLPTQYGESLVMRLLDQSGDILNLDKIGMNEKIKKRFRQLIHIPNGLILVTGPTGSGKSTTLYAALSEINSPEKKIITAEDPVEYRLAGVNQVQVRPKIELTFANVLRTALRQDPDIILVGEMRDSETTEIAIRAALTGHLVLSTLHTNDAASSAMRLIDMGTPGYLVAATLRGILAQRLVRKICDSCKTKYTLNEQEKIWLEHIAGEEMQDTTFFHGKGCSYCNETGYQGREGIFELLELNADMMISLSQNDPTTFSKQAQQALKGQLLSDHGLEMAKEGITTIEEVMKTVGY